MPKLGGQHAAYIVKALQAYKSGDRSHPSMRAIAAGLSDKDMADLAAYYAAEPAKSAAKDRGNTNDEKAAACTRALPARCRPSRVAGNPEAGKEKSATCAACHGPDGNSAAAGFSEARRPALRLPREGAEGLQGGRAQEPDHGAHGRKPHQRDIEDLAAYFFPAAGARHKVAGSGIRDSAICESRGGGVSFCAPVCRFQSLIPDLRPNRTVLCRYSHKSRIRHVGHSGFLALHT